MAAKFRYFPSSNYIVLFTILFLFTIAAAPSSPKISYADHCDSVVPQYPSTGTFLSPSKFLEVSYGHFSGGEKFLAGDPGSSPDFTDYPNAGRADHISKTKSPEILQLGGHVSFRGPQIKVRNPHRPGLYKSVFQSSIIHTSKYVNFELSGFWSESTGMICMVGTGSSYTFKVIMISHHGNKRSHQQ